MRFLINVLLLTAFSCQNSDNHMKIEILKSQILPVSAASGAEFYKDHLYVISDNTEGISICDLKGNLTELISLSEGYSADEVIEKKHKSDYEACTLISRNHSDYLLIVGSGSKKENRTKAKLVSLDGSKKVENFDLADFYEKMRNECQIKFDDFNIEALAAYDNKLFFFNRGTNQILIVKERDFFHFFELEDKDFKCKLIQLELDKIDGVSAGISGASISEDGLLVISASAEETDNWYDDGEIAGSSIGIIQISDLEKNNRIQMISLKKKGQFLKTKIESVAIQSIDDKKAKLFLVSDNDGKASELFQVELLFD